MTRFIAFFVRDDQTGAIKIHEIVEAIDLSVDDLSRRTIDRRKKLHESLPIGQYDVFSESYSSFEGMRRKNHEFHLDAAQLITWSPSAHQEPSLASNAIASHIAKSIDGAWWKDQTSLVSEADEPLTVIGPRADVTAEELKRMGERLKNWRQANAFVRHIWGLVDLLEGRGPRTPPVYLMVPYPRDRIAECYEPVALVFVAAATDHKAAAESLTDALADFRGRLTWLTNPAAYSDLRR